MKIEITQEQINKINSLAPNEWQTNEQGIWEQPYGVPSKATGLFVYMRYETGGYSGGSCWDESDPQYYSSNNPVPKFKVLDLVLQELKPDITYLQFKQVEDLIVDSEKTEYEYYGNSTDYAMKFISLNDLLKLLNSF